MRKESPYEAPEIQCLGPVEEPTFGGNLYPAALDGFTGYVGYRRPYATPAANDLLPPERSGTSGKE